MVGGVSPAKAAEIPAGIYFIATPSASCSCVGSVRAAQPDLYPCDNGDQRQQWEFTPSPSQDDPASFRQVRNVNDNMCPDARDSGGRVTGDIHLRDRNGSANQAWDLTGGDLGQGVVCVWKRDDCDMKLEHDPPWPTPILIFLADKFSHPGGWDIWLKKATTNPPNCQIDPRSCA
ncbi:hypothetical protein AB0I81_54070 [Nonomuraea sp. NPDC050404]|uniref:RICIN domain-containing protein n=1 Tax=Nonomuraea sp. NPDC050404 TaxID=3155783 RepID=UPI0033FC1248